MTRKRSETAGTLDEETRQAHLGDKGYIGLDMITPIKKSPHRGLLDWEKKFNHNVGAVRYQIERTIANLKTWRILHTDYRRPIHTFAQTITTTIALQFYRQAF
jgi:DDE superfamily endonuclease